VSGALQGSGEVVFGVGDGGLKLWALWKWKSSRLRGGMSKAGLSAPQADVFEILCIRNERHGRILSVSFFLFMTVLSAFL